MTRQESREERIRSWAGWLSNMSVACFTAGVLGPLLGALAQGTEPTIFVIATELPHYFVGTGKGQTVGALLLLWIVFRAAASIVLRRLEA